MKKILFVICLLFAVNCFASDPVIKDTTISHVVYHIYQGPKGGRYIVRNSKTGKTYKQYLKK